MAFTTPGIMAVTNAFSGSSSACFNHVPQSLPMPDQRITGFVLQISAINSSNTGMRTIWSIPSVHEVGLRGLIEKPRMSLPKLGPTPMVIHYGKVYPFRQHQRPTTTFAFSDGLCFEMHFAPMLVAKTGTMVFMGHYWRLAYVQGGDTNIKLSRGGLSIQPWVWVLLVLGKAPTSTGCTLDAVVMRRKYVSQRYSMTMDSQCIKA